MILELIRWIRLFYSKLDHKTFAEEQRLKEDD